jgi:hypothetical protein
VKAVLKEGGSSRIIVVDELKQSGQKGKRHTFPDGVRLRYV